MLVLGIEMATSAQRDRFVENPVDQVELLRDPANLTKLLILACFPTRLLTRPTNWLN